MIISEIQIELNNLFSELKEVWSKNYYDLDIVKITKLENNIQSQLIILLSKIDYNQEILNSEIFNIQNDLKNKLKEESIQDLIYNGEEMQKIEYLCNFSFSPKKKFHNETIDKFMS